jgi:hypothetical protein
VEVLGVGVRVTVLVLQVSEQVPHVPLLGMRPALPAPGEVVAQEPVQHHRVADGEVAVDPVSGHPGVQRAPGVDVVLDCRLLVGMALAVVGGAQVVGVVGQHDGARAEVRPGSPGCGAR